MKKSRRTALGGVITALCCALMYMSHLIPVGSYAFPAIAGGLIVMIVIEINRAWAAGVYVAAALLSAFALPDAALAFALFFGYYPILKELYERLGNRTLSRILKGVTFNAALALLYVVSRFLFGLNLEYHTILGDWIWAVIILAANGMFVLYDIALTRMIALYLIRVRPKIKRMLEG